MRSNFGFEIQVSDIETTAQSDQRKADDLVILLTDFGTSFLKTLNEASYTWLKSLIESSHRLLWVSCSGAWDVDADHGLLDGFSRALRSEYFELHLVTLVLNGHDNKGSHTAFITQVVGEMMTREVGQAYEQEFLEIGGRLHTRRLVEATDLKAAMDANLVAYEVIHQPVDGGFQFELSTASFDPNADPYYIPRSEPLRPLQDGTYEAEGAVEIMVKAACLQDQHRLGQGNGSSTARHYFCSGVILETGASPQAWVCVEARGSSARFLSRTFRLPRPTS